MDKEDTIRRRLYLHTKLGEYTISYIKSSKQQEIEATKNNINNI